ncbi:bacillithiol system redox-active protein YtxJ [Bacillus daqingensis]|uniref:Bacillithiol system redox-active protein YtxJ n=1 Tax=Bacillus daqingensis TaxID=872396 RepID=A0ABV9NZV4_9BACI
MTLKKLEDNETLRTLYERPEPFLIFKHSTTCPISSEAWSELQSYADISELPIYYLHVQEFRSGSADIAETYSVKHESPQALLVHNQRVLWHDSHWNITKDSLQQAEAGVRRS